MEEKEGRKGSLVAATWAGLETVETSKGRRSPAVTHASKPVSPSGLQFETASRLRQCQASNQGSLPGDIFLVARTKKPIGGGY
jgi:hypothetical protein